MTEKERKRNWYQIERSINPTIDLTFVNTLRLFFPLFICFISRTRTPQTTFHCNLSNVLWASSSTNYGNIRLIQRLCWCFFSVPIFLLCTALKSCKCNFNAIDLNSLRQCILWHRHFFTNSTAWNYKLYGLLSRDYICVVFVSNCSFCKYA